MSIQSPNITLNEQSFPVELVVRIQALSRAYLTRKAISLNGPSYRLSQLSSLPSLRSLSRQVRYARAEAALRSALLKCESESNPLAVQIRVMQNGLAAWNMHVIHGQQRVQNAERAMAALQVGDQSPALSRFSLSELQKEKWMGIKERDEALEMVRKIKQLTDELKKELQSGSKRSSLVPTPTYTHEADEPPSSKAKMLFSGRFPYPYLERLPRSRHSVEPLRLPLKHEESRRRASSLSGPSKPTPNSPLSVSSASTSSAVSIEEDCFGAVVIYPSDRLRTPDKRELQDQSVLPSYVDTLLDELSEDRFGSPKFDLSGNILRAMSSPATPTSQKTAAPSSYQTPPTPKPKSRVLLRHPLSNLSVSTFKTSHHEPSMSQSSTGTFVYVPENTPSDPSTPPMTPRKKLSRIESVMDSVKKSVKRVSFKSQAAGS